MDEERIKRPRHNHLPERLADRIATIHTVTCDRTKLHESHPSEARYLDVPRLLRGDSKASPLRGQNLVDDVDEILENNDRIDVMVDRKYSCTNYHQQMDGLFRHLPQPEHPRLGNLLGYFFFLEEAGKEAVPISKDVTLVSEELKCALSELTGMDIHDLENLNSPRNMRDLYHHFYFYRRDGRIGMSGLGQSELDQIEMFRQFMEQTFGTEYSEADGLFNRSRVTERHLRKLFRPGEILVTHQDEDPVAYEVQSSYEDASGQVSLVCRSWDFDGSFYQTTRTLQLSWPMSETEIDIKDLEIYPLCFDGNGLAERLRRRGETFWQCRQRKYVAYSPAPARATVEFQTIIPRYMVDALTYEQIHSTEQLTQRQYTGPAVADEEPPEDPFILLLPASIRGFALHDKKWQTLSVERIKDISWNVSAFNHLVLRHTKKELIQALIASHTGSRSADVIEGKGNGLILLLHGGPGTGKTLTAESVAELTHRPLYRVTCGDIGTNAEDVEGYLETVFYLGRKWNCVVLLDEADIFLEERTPTDLHRNALVSVFLRVLEYYEGILILTSNRIGTFDEAFKSRVQLTLHYPPLKQSGRRQIWNNFINRLQSSGIDARIDELREKVDRLSTNELNGREIRNAIQTATLLAQFRGETLGFTHLKEVIKVSNEFEKYLSGIHGHSASDWAKAQGTRAD